VPVVNPPISILFEDSHCLAIVKPPGQLTQGTWAPPGELTLEAAVRRYLNPSDPRAVYLGMVHRLDRPTSGVLIWAKTSKAARRLCSQFEHRRVVKEYWAIVERNRSSTTAASAADQPIPDGVLGEEIWTDWLTRADESGVVSIVAPHRSGAREAVTKVDRAEAVALPPGCAWLRFWPQTGRTHQLRAQSTRRGAPILGDSTYGATLPTPISPGIALHARLLTVRHPILNQELKLVAPLPSTWAIAGIILPEPVEAAG
jgi:23S rRNA pseudouridine1911/1915/1917 synthase